MALKMLDNGQYVVKTLAEAQEALAMMRELEAEIRTIQKEHGIDEMMQDATELKKAAQAYAVEKGLERIEGDGFHGTLISQSFDSHFIATDEDLANEEPAGRKLNSLRAIIRKKFGPYTKGSKSSQLWRRATKPVVDRTALDEIVAEGLLTVKEITPAFVEKKKSPYLRIFEDD
jgi:hypothetical protein